MENFIKFVLAVGGSTITFLFGGWSVLLSILLTFVVIDYVSGVVAAGIEGKLKSSFGLIGIARKVFLFLIVVIAHLIDTLIGEAHLIRDATIFFYLVNELLSIIENAGRIGLPIPKAIKKAVEVLKQKGGQNDEK